MVVELSWFEFTLYLISFIHYFAIPSVRRLFLIYPRKTLRTKNLFDNVPN